MLQHLILSALLVPLCAYAVTTVHYEPSDVTFANPERGWYHHTATHAPSYTAPLNLATLTGYRLNENITLILRLFVLDGYTHSMIPASYLANVETDFNTLRESGLKAVVRFCYTTTVNNGDGSWPPRQPYGDAPEAWVLTHLTQLQPVLHRHKDVIATVQAGFIGIWGEWYYTDYFGSPPNAPNSSNLAARRNVVQHYLSVLPNTRTVQLRTPAIKQSVVQETQALTWAQAFNASDADARLGQHNDCFLASSTDFGTYSNTLLEYPWLNAETQFVPMGGETCAVNAPRSQCPTAMTELSMFHWSYLNTDYNQAVLNTWTTCRTNVSRRLGYRFELVRSTLPDTVMSGQQLSVTFTVHNKGFASLYNRRPLWLVLRSTSSTTTVTLPVFSPTDANVQFGAVTGNINPLFWSANATRVVSCSVTIPPTLPLGTYTLWLHLPDANSTLASRPEYSVRLANAGVWDASTGMNRLSMNGHTMTVLAAPTAAPTVAPTAAPSPMPSACSRLAVPWLVLLGSLLVAVFSGA